MVQSELVMNTESIVPLTSEEQRELDWHEAAMETSQKEYLEHLRAIHTKRLYRTYGTFDQYCQDRWGFTANYARKQLRAMEVLQNLESGTIVPILPANEAQTRPLTSLDPELQRDAWDQAVKTAPNGKVTAAHVERVVDNILAPEPEEEALPVKTDPPAPAAIIIPPPEDRHAVHYRSDDPRWQTPELIIERVIAVFGSITLDPCSNSKTAPNVPAEYHYTKEDDGLAHRWWGKVYMNPPYGKEIGLWTHRLLHAFEMEDINEAIALLPARTDTRWFRPLMGYPCCFVHGRLRFLRDDESNEDDTDNSAPFPSVVVYLGTEEGAQRFKAAFKDIGTVMRRDD